MMSKTNPSWPLIRIALLIQILTYGLLLPSEIPANAESHKPDFFVRLSVGPGEGRSTMTFSEDHPDYKVSGLSTDLTLAMGAMVFPSIVLHGTAFGWVIPGAGG